MPLHVLWSAVENKERESLKHRKKLQKNCFTYSNLHARSTGRAHVLKTDMSSEVPVQIMCDACGTLGWTIAEDRDCQVFGELALLYSKPRTATVQFAGNTSTQYKELETKAISS